MPELRKVTSLDSTSSVSSTSSQRISGNRDNGHDYATTAAVTTSYGRNLSDVCAVVIHCPKHEKFCLAPMANQKGGYWLPYVPLKQSEGWYASIVNKLRQLLKVQLGVKSSSVFTPPEILHILRIQLPDVLKYVNRVVFMTNLQSIPVSSPSTANASALKGISSNHPMNSESPKLIKSKTSIGSQDGRSGGPKPSSPTTATATTGSQSAATGPGGFQCFCNAKEDPKSGLRWLKHENIVSEEENYDIWGPEPGMFTSAFATKSVEKGAYSEYTLREAIRYQPRDQPRNYHEEMLSSCHFERSDILRLYSDYVQHCFPSQNMNFVSFRNYMVKLGYEQAGSSTTASSNSTSSPEASAGAGAGAGGGAGAVSGLNVHDMRALYKAFKFNKSPQPYVTFHELLLGLAAMDKSTAHGAHVGEIRSSYIFRYYDTNSDGLLSLNELRVMALDRLRLGKLREAQQSLRAAAAAIGGGQTIKSASNSSSNRSASISSRNALAAAAASTRIDQDSLNRELLSIYKMLGLKWGDSLGEMDFLLAVGSMRLRGTSGLFRSQVSVIPVKQYYETSITERQALTDIEGNLVGTELAKRGTCPRCREKRYVLALHTVKLTQDAQIVEPTEVRFDEHPAPISRAQRQLSRAIFASDSTPNKLIDMISAFWGSLAAAQQANSATGPIPGRMLVGASNAVPLGKTSWERVDRQTLAEDIRRVCSQAEALFRREPRVVPVNSPCFVLGDIHGNLSDLRTYERILWPNAPSCVAGSYLFLGDYVDRGEFGLECICYLLSMKVLAPQTFYLLRGNHELRSIQQAFTFFREVAEKFRNQQLGFSVWETLNKTFDLMPIAATIDEQIFCAHGGIPTSALRLDELYSIPTPLMDPENQSAAAWEMLWNDPVSSTEYAEYADLLRRQPGGEQAVANMHGYLPNTKRGTAFFFSEEAVRRFLHLNGLSHIIRAHECVPPGYALHSNGKVITIFSSSHYCGATNDAACILVEREKIRIIRLDTD